MNGTKVKTISDGENFLRAVEFRNPEWIPIRFIIFPGIWERYGKDLRDLFLAHPLIGGELWRGYGQKITDPMFIEGATFTDYWGCVWHNAQAGIIGRVIKNPLADWKAFETFKAPDPAEEYNWDRLKQGIEELREKGLPVIGSMETFSQGGFFDRMIALRGYENLLMDFMDEPPQLSKMIDMLLDYNIKYIKKWIEIGPDILWHHGDIGSQHGLMISPETFRKYLKPAYKEMFLPCRKAGIHVWKSSDGNVLDVVDDFVECGISVHDPQVGANTIDDIASHYKGKLCACADLDRQMLPFCTPEDINQQIKEIVEKVSSPEGGLMINAELNDVPLENAEAIITAWEEHCFYNWSQ